MTGMIKRQSHASMKNLCQRLTLAGPGTCWAEIVLGNVVRDVLTPGGGFANLG